MKEGTGGGGSTCYCYNNQALTEIKLEVFISIPKHRFPTKYACIRKSRSLTGYVIAQCFLTNARKIHQTWSSLPTITKRPKLAVSLIHIPPSPLAPPPFGWMEITLRSFNSLRLPPNLENTFMSLSRTCPPQYVQVTALFTHSFVLWFSRSLLSIAVLHALQNTSAYWQMSSCAW